MKPKPSSADETLPGVLQVLEDGGIEREETVGEGRITEPFDPVKIRIDSKPLSLDILLKRIGEDEIDLNPSFQRKEGIWSDEAQSRLIESILIRIPLPAFYMDATDENKWLVVDGLQRLTALNRFVNKKSLTLSGLEFLTQFERKGYDDLGRSFQRRINETQATVFLIEKGTPPAVKFNIFKRINTGGLPLSAQEIRHALNQGEASKYLGRLAGLDEFRLATNGSINDKRMADRECALRFLAFSITPFRKYKTKDFDSFLNDTMVDLNKMNQSDLDAYEGRFKKALIAVHKIFGSHAFRKMYQGSNVRYPINKALFESWCTCLGSMDQASLDLIVDKKEEVIGGFKRLMKNREFENSISQGTGDIRKVKLRFEGVEKVIREAL